MINWATMSTMPKATRAGTRETRVLIVGTGLALIWFESRKRSGADQTAEVFR